MTSKEFDEYFNDDISNQEYMWWLHQYIKRTALKKRRLENNFKEKFGMDMIYNRDEGLPRFEELMEWFKIR